MNIKEENYSGDKKMNHLFKALCAKLEGEIAVAKANLAVYQSNSAGIGEHPDVVEAIESQVAKLADAEDKLEAIKRHF